MYICRHNTVCSFCVTVKKAINLSVYKIYVQKLPVHWSEILVPLDVYLHDKLLPCELFFIVKNNKVSLRLDNLSEKHMCGKATDF